MKRIPMLLAVVLSVTASLFAQVPSSKHVYVVALENKSYEHLVGSSNMPYLNSLFGKGTLATQFYANRHTSITDYFLVTSGVVPTTNDTTSSIYDVDNMVRHLMSLGLTYKVYAQSLPYAGYAGLNNGNYLKRHTALPYYSDMGNSTTEMKKLVPIAELPTDIQNDALPNFAFITPDAAHDLHNCPSGEAACEQMADSFLKTYIAPLLASKDFQPGGDGLLIVWSDEADLSTDNRCSATVSSGCGGRVVVAMVGPQVKANYKSTATYHHQHVLKTMLEALGTTSNFPGLSSTASAMSDFFTTSATTAPIPTPNPTPMGMTINVTSPTANSTVPTTVTLAATATGPNPVTAVQVYVDSVMKASATGSSINAQVTMAAGTHALVFKAWDSTGANVMQSETITVSSTTSGEPSSGVWIQSPLAGSTPVAPVHVVASSVNQTNITSMKVYVDGTAVFSKAGTSLDTYISMSSGSHKITVKDWNSSGTATSSSVTITVP